jgi:hypothetical protein
MGSWEYARIMEQQTGFAARLFVVESESSAIAYPFLLRPIDGLPFAQPDFAGRWDTVTPEYTGRLYIGPEPCQEPGGMGCVDRFAGYCRENGIIAEFAHLNPWRDVSEALDPAGVVANREIVYVDLTLGETGIWTQSLTSDARRQTKQALQAGIRVRRAKSLDDVAEFHRLHANTMERRQALERYRLPLEYFAAIFETMPANAFFVLAEYQGRVVAGGLYFHGGPDVYWHLSAADMEFSRVRPVNGYLWETILWAAGEGKQRMLLGAGYKPGDGIFRFKAGFSPARARFCTYRRVHDERGYAALTDAWSAHHGVASSPGDFFPAYRANAPQPVEEQSGDEAAA